MWQQVLSPLESVYAILFNPWPTFEDAVNNPQTQERHMVTAMVILLCISLITTLTSPAVASWPISMGPFVITLAFRLFAWFFVIFVFTLAGYCFGQRFQLKPLMILSAYALLPWLFVPILKIFPAVYGNPGQWLAMLGLVTLGIWTTTLFVMALKLTYRLPMEKLIALVALPFLMGGLGLGWVSGVLVNLVQWMLVQTL